MNARAFVFYSLGTNCEYIWVFSKLFGISRTSVTSYKSMSTMTARIPNAKKRLAMLITPGSLVVGRSSTESMRVGSGRFTVDCQVPQPQRHLENVFSIVVSNTDDHLHNHRFLLVESGWELSPTYDINPSPQGHGLSLNITDTDNS